MPSNARSSKGLRAMSAALKDCHQQATTYGLCVKTALPEVRPRRVCTSVRLRPPAHHRLTTTSAPRNLSHCASACARLCEHISAVCKNPQNLDGRQRARRRDPNPGAGPSHQRPAPTPSRDMHWPGSGASHIPRLQQGRRCLKPVINACSARAHHRSSPKSTRCR